MGCSHPCFTISPETRYRLMRLDTGTFLPSAIKLYTSLGFKPVEPYYEVPEDILKLTVFLEMDLGRGH